MPDATIEPDRSAAHNRSRSFSRTIVVYLFLTLLLIVVALVFASVYTIDDWSRDLVRNRAETSADAKDPRLHPIPSTLAPPDLAALVESTAERLSGWKRSTREESEERIEIGYERTTRLWRFVDDVVVTIRPTETGSELQASSQSRVGRGDLGQNPRNLVELLERVRDCIRE